jgi:hypothetical protein
MCGSLNTVLYEGKERQLEWYGRLKHRGLKLKKPGVSDRGEV